MSKIFYRLGPNDLLVDKLKKAVFWKNILPVLKADKDINVQVRGRSLNIYYKMNSLLKIELDRKGEISCSTHYKFLPLIKREIKPDHPLGKIKRGGKEQTNCYVAMAPEGNCLSLPESSQYEYKIIENDLLAPENLKLLKEQMSRYANEEKECQSKLIDANKKTILDAEVAFNEREQNEEDPTKVKIERTRIDLLNYDKNTNQLIAIELKMILDGRLYNGKIEDQLGRYVEFLRKRRSDLRQAYKNVRDVKCELGLLSKDSLLAGVDFKGVEVAPKPLLVVVCYGQPLIDTFREKILKAVKDCAMGAFFFGFLGDLNLPSRKHPNKVIF